MGSPPAYYSNTPSPQEPVAEPPQVQLINLLQGLPSTSGGGSGGDSPTRWAGEENLQKGEEDPSRPKAQARRGPVIGVALACAPP